MVEPIELVHKAFGAQQIAGAIAGRHRSKSRAFENDHPQSLLDLQYKTAQCCLLDLQLARSPVETHCLTKPEP